MLHTTDGGTAAVRLEPAGDGYRVVSDCAGGCGARVVTIPQYIGHGRCITCGRARWGAAVPQRPAPGETRRNGLALGQPGASWPGRLDPDRLAATGALRPESRVVESGEVGPDHPDVPAQASALARRMPGARLLRSVARDTTTEGRSTWVSVQWREGGEPPTVMVLWRNGRRDHAMIGWRKTTHTAVGAVTNGRK